MKIFLLTILFLQSTSLLAAEPSTSFKSLDINAPGIYGNPGSLRLTVDELQKGISKYKWAKISKDHWAIKGTRNDGVRFALALKKAKNLEEDIALIYKVSYKGRERKDRHILEFTLIITNDIPSKQKGTIAKETKNQ